MMELLVNHLLISKNGFTLEFIFNLGYCQRLTVDFVEKVDKKAREIFDFYSLSCQFDDILARVLLIRL